ncbi:MAG: hypothetical protein KAR47_01820 [Planctomycetes bacterium]|nr:hypothetical protein [Planctomycetota bacterium]
MNNKDRRKEKRLQYNWPVWFADYYDGDVELTQGQMFDITSESATFTCYADKCPMKGEQITTRFSVPKYGDGDSFDMEHFIRSGKVLRIEQMSDFVRKVAFEFAEALPFKPGEVEDSEALAIDTNEELTANKAKEFAEDVMTTIGAAKLEGVSDIVNDNLQVEEANTFAEDILVPGDSALSEACTEDIGSSL